METPTLSSFLPRVFSPKTLAILLILSFVSSSNATLIPPAISQLLFAASQFSNSSLSIFEAQVGSRSTGWRRPDPLSRAHEGGIVALSHLNGWSGDNLMSECYGLAHVWLRPSEPIPGVLPIPPEERNTPFWTSSAADNANEKSSTGNAGIRSVDIVSRTAMSVGLSRDLVKLQEAWQKTYKSAKVVFQSRKKVTTRLLIDLLKASEATNIASAPSRINEIMELSKNSTITAASNGGASGLHGPAAAHLLGLSAPMARSLSSLYSLTGHIAHVTETALSNKDELESIASAIYLRLNMSIGMCAQRWETRRTGDMIVDPSDPKGLQDHAELRMLSPDGQAEDVFLLEMDKDARSIVENDPLGRVKEPPAPPRPSGAKLDLNPAIVLTYIKDVVTASENLMGDALGALTDETEGAGVVESVCLLRVALNHSLPSLSTPHKSTTSSSSAASTDAASADSTCKRLLTERSKRNEESLKCFPRISVSGSQADCVSRLPNRISLLDAMPDMVTKWMSNFGDSSCLSKLLPGQNATCFESKIVEALVKGTIDSLNTVRSEDEDEGSSGGRGGGGGKGSDSK
jgi:hypothetical protein